MSSNGSGPGAEVNPDAKEANGEPALEGAVTDELEDKRMSLLEHLQELRVRLRNAGIAFLAAMILSFVFVREFFAVLISPDRGRHLRGHRQGGAACRPPRPPRASG